MLLWQIIRTLQTKTRLLEAMMASRIVPGIITGMVVQEFQPELLKKIGKLSGPRRLQLQCLIHKIHLKGEQLLLVGRKDKMPMAGLIM
jgi:hypothetical protein